MVSSRILSRVLFPQMGQRMNSVFFIPVILHPDPYLSAPFFPILSDQLVTDRDTNANQKNYR